MRASYGQLGAGPEPSHRRRRAGCITLVLTATLLLVAGIALLAVLVPRSNKGGDSADGVPRTTSAAAKLCTGTGNPALCNSILANAPNASTPQQWVETLVHALAHALGSSADLVNATAAAHRLPNATQAALQVCAEVLGYSDDYLAAALATLHNLTASAVAEQLDEVQTYLSAVATGLQTCLEELVQAANPVGSYPNTFNDTQLPGAPTDPFSTGNTTRVTADLASIALYFVDYLTQVTGGEVPDIPAGLGLGSFSFGGLHRRRRLLGSDGAGDDSSQSQRRWYEHAERQDGADGGADFPGWMQPGARRALLDLGTTKAKKWVSPDGKGDYRRIQDAVDAAPSLSDSIYVIYIAAGTYREQVTIPKDKHNVAFVGAGIDKTIISGFRSVGGGSTTYLSATLAVNGLGFLATALTVSNTAGPDKFQAVAARVSADKVAFYRVKLTGFQDTLYAHSLRQFYRECTIVGTVDYIFGNAAAVFQKCTLLASTGILGQQNTITAQGRTDKSMNTGFSFQACTIAPTKQLQKQLASYRSYLGRPWKLYSRTVYLGCTVSGIIDPAGWLPWNATFALDTLFYGEYRNKGPGSAVAGRVPWSTQMTTKQTKKFLLKKLNAGSSWLPPTGIPFGTTFLA